MKIVIFASNSAEYWVCLITLFYLSAVVSWCHVCPERASLRSMPCWRKGVPRLQRAPSGSGEMTEACGTRTTALTAVSLRYVQLTTFSADVVSWVDVGFRRPVNDSESPCDWSFSDCTPEWRRWNKSVDTRPCLHHWLQLYAADKWRHWHCPCHSEETQPSGQPQHRYTCRTHT